MSGDVGPYSSFHRMFSVENILGGDRVVDNEGAQSGGDIKIHFIKLKNNNQI